MRRSFWISLLFTSAFSLHAADVYIRQGASGDGSGSDWTNARTSIGSMARGNTYWLADGAYTSPALNVAQSGTTLITLKKATVASHGTSTGGSDTYGDGQATFSTQWAISTGYWTVDGQTRGADWTSGYGIKIQVSTGNSIRFTGTTTLPDVTLRYLDLQGGGIVSESTVGSAVYAHMDGVIQNLLIEYCYTHGFWPDPFVLGDRDFPANGITVQYCFVDQNRTSSNFHGQSFADHSASNVTIRWNRFRNPEGTAVYTVIGWGQVLSGLYIYGNTVWNTTGYTGGGVSAFVEIIQTATISTIRVHNNTLYNVKWWPRIVHYWATGSDRLAYNNAWVNCSGLASGNDNFTLDWNYFNNTAHAVEANEQTATGAVFVNPGADDFRLLAATTAGNNVGAPYNVDVLGVTRGADGTWDRGAYEFAAGGEPAPRPL